MARVRRERWVVALTALSLVVAVAALVIAIVALGR